MAPRNALHVEDYYLKKTYIETRKIQKDPTTENQFRRRNMSLNLTCPTYITKNNVKVD